MSVIGTLKIAVAITKEERDKFKIIVDTEKAKKEALHSVDLNLQLTAALALSNQALKLSKQSLQSAIRSQCSAKTSTADGRPVMCAILIVASKLKLMDVTGFTSLSKDAEDVSIDEMKVLDDEIEAMKDEYSNGVDPMFPFGPTYTFNGSQVPTFITCSNNSSITSQLLTIMLSKMDDLELFDRSDGVNPFLLCDGHEIRFEEPFLEYTLESNMTWTCCIYVPYGTSMW
jgi:hypothetical protein